MRSAWVWISTGRRRRSTAANILLLSKRTLGKVAVRGADPDPHLRGASRARPRGQLLRGPTAKTSIPFGECPLSPVEVQKLSVCYRPRTRRWLHSRLCMLPSANLTLAGWTPFLPTSPPVEVRLPARVQRRPVDRLWFGCRRSVFSPSRKHPRYCRFVPSASPWSRQAPLIECVRDGFLRNGS